MSSAEHDLTNQLTRLFDLVGPLYRKAYRRIEQDSAAFDLSVGLRAVMVMLHARGPMTVPQIGRAQELSRQFVQRMANEGIEAGLLEPAPNPAHKRSSLLRLTDRGDRTVTALLEREHKALIALGAGLDPADIDTANAVLAHLLSGLGDIRPD
jgi:DNA-binding MarR family transcriptional regulator